MAVGAGRVLIVVLLVVVFLRQPLEILHEHQRLVRRDLEPFPTRLARHFVVDTDEVVLHLLKQRAVAFARAGGNLRFPGPAQPPYGVVVRAAATGTLQPGGSLLGLLVEEVTFVHALSVQQ